MSSIKNLFGSFLVLCTMAASAFSQQTPTPSAQPGLLAGYYSTTGTTNGDSTNPPAAPGSPSTPNLTIDPFLRRIDPIIDGTATNFQAFPPPNNPTTAASGSTDFLTAWVGFITITTTGDYNFNVAADDGMRLWIGTSANPASLPAAPTVDMWSYGGVRSPATVKVTINTAGTYAIRSEYFEGVGGAAARLLWQPPGTPGLVTIPTASLTSPVNPAAPTLTATSVPGAASIALSWTTGTPSATPATGYMIFRGTASGAEGMVPIATVAGTTYVDSAGLVFGTTYFYIVQPTAYAGICIGAASNEAQCAVNPFVATPVSQLIVENGGTGIITITTSSPIPNGVTVSFPVTVMTVGGGNSFNVSQGAQGPATIITATMLGNNSVGQMTQITVTGRDNQIASDPKTATIAIGPTSTNPNTIAFNGHVLPPVTCTQIESDIAGVIITPATGLAITNGGTAISFKVTLATIPSAPVNLTLGSTIPYAATITSTATSLDNTNWNTGFTVMVTPNNVDTTIFYLTSFYVTFTPVGSADGNYAGINPGSAYIFEATSTPPLQSVWGGGGGGGCGLTGLEGLAALALIQIWRRRKKN